MTKQDKKKQTQQSFSPDLDKDFAKYYWLIIPVTSLIYFAFSYYSTGFYQDDEVGHYVTMRDFWSDPWIIMSNWGKPGWKILLVVPSLFGYKAVLLVNSLIAGLTAYATILLAKEMKMKNTIIAGLLLAFQPLVLQLAFRSYAEIFTGLLLVLTLLFYFKEKYILSAILVGWAFTVRQESALLCLILAVFFIMNKKYIPLLFIATLPFILNLFGFIHTGDYFWAWTEMKQLSDFNLGIDRSFFHYFEVFIYIVGPVTFALFLVGIAKQFTKDRSHDFFKKEFLVYSFFFVVFLFQCYLVIKGTNPGSWRYLLQVSPFASLIALIGFNEMLDSKNKKIVLPVLIASVILTILYFSKEATGLLLTDKADYSRLISIALIVVVVLFNMNVSARSTINALALTVIVVSIGYTFMTEKPKQESPENKYVAQIAGWYNQTANKDAEVLYNHSLIFFYGDIFGEQKKHFKVLNHKSLNEAPKGTIVIWDSHYSFRPEYKNDVQVNSLQDSTKFKPLTQLVSPDKRFGVFIFEKL